MANLSLGSAASKSVDAAVNNAINTGISYAVSARNGNNRGRAINAYRRSPARVPAAISVSATDWSDDNKPAWAQLRIVPRPVAPGVDIGSASCTSDTGSRLITGTSMATPTWPERRPCTLQGAPGATPQMVTEHVLSTATLLHALG